MTLTPEAKAHPTPNRRSLESGRNENAIKQPIMDGFNFSEIYAHFCQRITPQKMYLPSATLTMSLFALLSRAAGVPKQTGENPFTYPLGDDLVDGAEIVNLTWKATTKSTITINLLKGDPKNLDDLGAIVGLLDNEGWYEWKVSKYLEDSGSMPKGHMYGLKITNDEDEGFEYSPPFNLRVLKSRFKRISGVKGKVNSTRPPPPERRSNSKKGVEWGG